MKASYISPIQTTKFPTGGSLQDQIRFCCQYGALAPSVHNLQPWSIALAGKQLTVSVYKGHHAEDSDATGRQTWISIGCFVENVLQAAKACGMKASIVKEDYANDAIVVEFGASKGKDIDEQILTNITSRVSNRNPFEPAKLSSRQLQQFKDLQTGIAGAQIFVNTDKATIALMTELTKQAVALALSIPQLKKELGQTFRANSSSHKTGIPGYALGYGNLRSKFEGFRFSHLPVAPKESVKESTRVQASAGFVFITASGDIAKHWFAAGRLYERAALLLAQLGLSQATIAATVEAPDFHQEVEKQIGTTNRLQAVIRFGKSTKKIAPSPRLSVDEILTSSASRD